MQLMIGLISVIVLGVISYSALHLQYYTCIRAYLWYRIASWARANGDAAVLRQANKNIYTADLTSDLSKKRTPMLVASKSKARSKQSKKPVHFGVVKNVLDAFSKFKASTAGLQDVVAKKKVAAR